MAEFEISTELIQKAMKQDGVRAQLKVVAERVASRARSIAASENLDMNVTVVSGIRPTGRPFSNVVVDNADQEFGTATTPRSRVLGRSLTAGAALGKIRDAAGMEGGG